MEGEDAELSYYRSVEDLFASLRGAPHILSPRDFQLLRTWWREVVPLAAVSAGLTEVFARNRERENADPVVSLSYCRHAVKRHAKRLAEMHLGQSDSEPGSDLQGITQDWKRVWVALTAAAEAQRENRPGVSAVLSRIAEQVEMAGQNLPPDVLDEHVFELESAMLHECWQALGHEERQTIDDRVEVAVSKSTVTEDARLRSTRALRDREVRLLLNLPRLELG